MNAVFATFLLLAAAQDVPPGSAGTVTSLNGTCWLVRSSTRQMKIDLGNRETTSLLVEDVVWCDRESSLELALNGLKTTIEPSDPHIGTTIRKITRPRRGVVSDPVDPHFGLGGLLVSHDPTGTSAPYTRVASSPGSEPDTSSPVERLLRHVRGVQWYYLVAALALVALVVALMARRNRAL